METGRNTYACGGAKAGRRGDGEARKLSEVFCAVYCNKYRYILQFASYESSFYLQFIYF
jgi:hypothetical protein